MQLATYIPYTEGMTEAENDLRIRQNEVAHLDSTLQKHYDTLDALQEAVERMMRVIETTERQLAMAQGFLVG